MTQTPINWRKRKRLWKKRCMWKPNHSNKSLHTYCRVHGLVKPKWNTIRFYMFPSTPHTMGHIGENLG